MASPGTPRRHLPRDPDEFGIEINFRPHSEAPSRVFRAMTALIESFQEIDQFLARSINAQIRPSTLLEDVESGSLRAWLRNVLENVDDESLKSGEWKKVIGAFLVKAKRIMIKWTEERATVDSQTDLLQLRQEILDAAAETDVLRIPTYTPITPGELVRSITLLTDAVKPLSDTDSVVYLSAELPAALNRAFEVFPEALTDLLVKESIPGETLMILMVKRPDFLGESRWEFRHEKRVFEAKIQDLEWLREFRNGVILLQPGDALRCIVRSEVRYGYDGEVIDSKQEIIKVTEVIHAIRPFQTHLFKPSGEV
jgi:hypothetical protein